MRHAHVPEPLWCLHVRGPDNIFAMPSQEEAERQAAALRSAIAESPIPGAVFCEPVAVAWPYSAQAHAEDLDLAEARFG